MKRLRNLLLLALFSSPLSPALAAPRSSCAGLIPDSIPPLYHESFDEAFAWGATNAQSVLGNYTLNESWSGYALQRSGAGVTPFYVPGVNATGRTNVNPAHLETLGTIEAVAGAKWEIVAGLKPGGTAVLNGDDAALRHLKGDALEDQDDVVVDDLDVVDGEISAHDRGAFRSIFPCCNRAA